LEFLACGLIGLVACGLIGVVACGLIGIVAYNRKFIFRTYYWTLMKYEGTNGDLHLEVLYARQTF
jgi:hypothetical protein